MNIAHTLVVVCGDEGQERRQVKSPVVQLKKVQGTELQKYQQ